MRRMSARRNVLERWQWRLHHALALARASTGAGAGFRGAWRGLQFLLLRRLTTIVAVEGDGVCYFVSTHDTGVGLPVYVHGALDPQDMRVAIDVLELSGYKPFANGPRHFVDIGANIGTSTIQAITRHGASGAIAFEPDDGNIALLRHNLLANGLSERVTVIQAAVTDKCAPVALERSKDNFGDHRVRLDVAIRGAIFREHARAVTTVTGVTLDSQVQSGALDLDRVGLVSIDTQGHEAHVLSGADHLRSADVPVMLEYWPYGLRAADGLEQLHAIIGHSYDRYVDLAIPFKDGRIAFHPATELGALAGSLHELGWTNILLFH